MRKILFLILFCNFCSVRTQNGTTLQENSTKVEIKPEADTENKNEPVLVHSTDYYCSCDLKPFLCDINCCCDKLCSDDDRKIFSHCHTSSKKSADSRYCYSRTLIYTINAVHQTSLTSGSLFCVAWDNVVKKDEYVARETITSLTELKRLSPSRKHEWFYPDGYPNLFVPKSHKHHSTSSKLKSGDALRALVKPSESAIDVPTFIPWKLPYSLPVDNGICNSFRPITYLENFKSKCVQAISDLRRECTSNPYLSPRIYHENIVISKNKPADVVIGSLHLTRHYLQENDDYKMRGLAENRYSIISEHCSSDGCVTVTVNGTYELPQYIYDGQRKIGACFNAVSSVSYDISFNVKTGITEIMVTFIQSPIIQGQKYLQQTFSTNFNQEINSSLLMDDMTQIEHSGNPGYIFSKAILGTNFSADMNSTGYIKLVDPIGSKSDGSCKLSTTGNREIGFKVNSKSGCRINLNNFVDRTGICSNLQSEIVNLWKINDKMTHFAIFGNSNATIQSQWIPIIVDNSMTQISHSSQVPLLTLDGNCPSIITSVSYDIYFADIGLKNEPQSMLLSVVKKYSDPIEVKMQLSNGTNQKLGSISSPWIEVSFSVAFHDLTVPSRPSFAPPPTVRLQLPPDFFYPFFVSSKGNEMYLSSILIFITFTQLLAIQSSLF